MARKRRPVYFQCFNLPGGATYAATPTRKPYTKKGEKPSPLANDPDLVATELETTLDDYDAYPTDTKQRAFPVLANRINTRRAIRELVLPELTAIVETLGRIEERLDRLERFVGKVDERAS